MLALVASLVSLLFDRGSDGTGAFFALNVLMVAGAPIAIGRALWRRPTVDVHTVLGAVCIYVLVGMLFAFLYGAVAYLGSTPFFVQTNDPSSADFLYFSFITLTTVGYGDYTAAGGLGRAVASIEALLGQIYLVTVVATIVSGMAGMRAARARAFGSARGRHAVGRYVADASAAGRFAESSSWYCSSSSSSRSFFGNMKNTRTAPSSDGDDARRRRPSLAPSTNDCLRRGGDLLRVLRVLLRRASAALENDFVSWLCTLSVICAAFGAPAIVLRERRRVAGREQRAEDRLHDGAAEVALEVGGTRRHAGARHRHRAGERVRRRRAREADADADERVAEADLPVRRVPSSQSSEHREEAEEAEDVARRAA